MPTVESKLTEITAKIKAQTDKAYLLDDGKVEAWCSKSIVQDNEDGTFTMPEWLAIEKDLA